MAYRQQLLPMEKVFRDPVHDYIYIQHQVILDLINTSEFQRLRRIKQLGTTSLTFHGAEHSRFGHCLGVYEITRRICDNFERNYPTQALVTVVGMITSDWSHYAPPCYTISVTGHTHTHSSTSFTPTMKP